MHEPLTDREYLIRYLNCREALRYPVKDLIDGAIARGWTHDEVTTALINLAAELFPDKGSRLAPEELGEPAPRRARLRH